MDVPMPEEMEHRIKDLEIEELLGKFGQEIQLDPDPIHAGNVRIKQSPAAFPSLWAFWSVWVLAWLSGFAAGMICGGN